MEKFNNQTDSCVATTDLTSDQLDNVTTGNHIPAATLGLSDEHSNIIVSNVNDNVITDNTLQNTGVDQPNSSITLASENNSQDQSALDQEQMSKQMTDGNNPPHISSGLSSSEEFPEVNEKLKYVENAQHASIDTIEAILSIYSSPYRRRL